MIDLGARPSRVKVIVVDDRDDERQELEQLLREECGFEPHFYTDYRLAHTALLEQVGDRLLVHYQLGSKNKNLGAFLLQKLKKEMFDVPTVIVSSVPDDYNAVLRHCTSMGFTEIVDATNFHVQLPRIMAIFSRGGTMSRRIFIGHGGSKEWLVLQSFLKDRLDLAVDEFNSTPTAGVATVDRLKELLDNAGFAFLMMTAEDETSGGEFNPRLNVVHEAGLFQGRLGFKKAIILLEDGCREFSNIHGIGQIRFPKGNITAKFEEIRRTLEREGIITTF